ncbi:hypothetical protein [Thermosipho sp. (in: thermotogales)]|uniref:hypothetical protein n=1 Tax=Thermosipho sp. (in: thermotogales) TaxID=1968895 RepID=UPI00257A49E5|nr:hypothetical protein [Thermosipho sp. (in: thermotogales)]MBZ4651051.1 hypothetical protein [Thermosipho sp. (in: thermotogales)]
MKKFILAWLVVFLSISVFSAIDSNIRDTILDEATIKTTTFNFLNPYVTRIKPEQVTEDIELTGGGYDSIDKMLVYGVLGQERDLSNYIIFEVEFDDFRGIKKSTLLKNNIFIEGVPVENFELIYMVVTASGYFGTYGCRGDGDAKLYLIGYVENLQSILNNNETITMEIKSEKEKIEFQLTDKLSKLIDFANLY